MIEDALSADGAYYIVLPVSVPPSCRQRLHHPEEGMRLVQKPDTEMLDPFRNAGASQGEYTTGGPGAEIRLRRVWPSA